MAAERGAESGATLRRIPVRTRPSEVMRRYGADVLSSPGMQREKLLIQHGETTVYAHSVRVALLSVRIAQALRLKVNPRALVRGALLHDYFLYDWHKPHPDNKWHGFTHPRTALQNAERDFELDPRERDMILRHMFPLVPVPPVHREGFILCLADKISALRETVMDRVRARRRKRGSS